ncbi:MAG: hypothetical protein ACE5WD_02000 [Candidatus Aminicenantia bacterium]
MGILLLIGLNLLFTQNILSADRQIQGTIEFTVGSYNMNEPRFKAVYQDGGLIQGIGLSAFFIYDFDFYLEIKRLYKLGQLTYTKEETKFLLIPISLGFRYIKPIGQFRPYLGGGMDFYFYYEANPIGTVFNYTKGYHFQGGTYFQIVKDLPFWLNLKLKYTKAKTEENNHKIELGGFEYGVSLVIAF